MKYKTHFREGGKSHSAVAGENCVMTRNECSEPGQELGVRYSFANQLVECTTWSGARGMVFLCSGVSVSFSKYIAVGLIC